MSVMSPLTNGAAPTKPGFYRGLVALALLSACADAAAIRQQVDVITALTVVETASVYTTRIVSTRAGVTFDRSYSVTTTGTTAAALIDLIDAALRADEDLGRLITLIEQPTTETLRLTWAMERTGTITFTANPGTDLSVATTAAGFTQYLFGQAVQLSQSGAALLARNPLGTGGGTIVVDLATNNTAQAISWDMTVTAPDGTVRQQAVTATSDTTAALTIAALVVALEAAFPEADVEITTADEVITVTFPPGYSPARTSPIVDGTVVLTAVTTPAEALPEIGIVHYDRQHTAPVENPTGPTEATGPRPGMTFNVVRGPNRGIEYIVPLASGSPAMGGPVYADTSGGWHAAAAAGRTFCRGLRWGSYISTSFASIAL